MLWSSVFSSTLIALGLLDYALAVKVNPLPAPSKITWQEHEDTVVFNPRLKLECKSKNKILHDAWDRAISTISSKPWRPAATEGPVPHYDPFPTRKTSPAAATHTKSSKRGNPPKPVIISTAVVEIENDKIDLGHGVDDSYRLEVSAKTSQLQINAKTVWGALNAFNTLRQIVILDDHPKFIIEKPVVIEDKPLYPVRGLMIDTARNFVSIPKLKLQIEAMSMAKLNFLHWHLSDTLSWPLELKSFPQMEKDAFSPAERYSQKQVADLISYAKARGVRVVPEIDMPAHANSGWKQIDPKLISCGNSWWSNDDYAKHTSVEPIPGQLDIMYNKTYDVVEKVHSEVASMFQDTFLHVGGDEIQPNCYNFSSDVMDWFDQDKSRTFGDLFQHWVDKAYPIFSKDKNRRVLMWEDILVGDVHANRLPKDVILQTWQKGLSNIKKITSMGHDLIVSSADFLYLDCGSGGWITNDPRYNVQNQPPGTQNDSFNYAPGIGADWCSPYKTWQRIYDFDFTTNLTAAEKKHVLGAVAALWSEQVDDTVVTMKIWPRAAALAELTWSGNRNAQGNKRTTEMTQRILNFREFLVHHGIEAAPLVSQYCLRHPHACDLYRDQNAVQKNEKGD